MRFGLYLPQGELADARHDVITVACEAERAGYNSLWAFERVMFPLAPADGMSGVPGLPWVDAYRHTTDPLTVLTLAAAVTEKVRLGTGILVAGLRPAHLLARTMATLDQLSGGRAVLGLGAGWSSDEFRAVGADFRRRGRSLEETIDACRALWGSNPVSYQDSRMVVDNALVNPKPLARLPILLGGGKTDVALDRIARKADGWIPSGLGPVAVAGQWKRIRDLAAGHGRNPAELGLYPQVRPLVTAADLGSDRMPGQGSMAQVVADLAAYAEAGADEALIAILDARSAGEMVDKAGALMTAVTEAGLRQPTGE
ncbi:TIGR03619 family F420-dependent LLM class oxidoreductase [Kutzneria sp. CA-103260]|uniref:TIGR03619 family F420-dependent LLM class oxidoreductase n=1 Tax=Kutzneria sp. CA-103260 TaxID=2802641 RepID=UPI001BAA9DAF|nr:TIGR03619 family F420-dependent LLM class oxidoreductase [Kutzneria sp. CA-103260]QUQ63829.1 LLM class F420-dependent oxidoreductase [Kutzneria sp. CA-103260]